MLGNSVPFKENQDLSPPNLYIGGASLSPAGASCHCMEAVISHGRWLWEDDMCHGDWCMIFFVLPKWWALEVSKGWHYGLGSSLW